MIVVIIRSCFPLFAVSLRCAARMPLQSGLGPSGFVECLSPDGAGILCEARTKIKARAGISS